MSRYRNHVTAVALVLSSVGVGIAGWPAPASATPVEPSSGSQVVTVDRPAGQIVVSDLALSNGGPLAVTVTDTRANDPGWTVSVTLSASGQLGWKPYVVEHTAPFVDSDGTMYAQEVTAGASIPPRRAAHPRLDDAVLGSAAAGHGLGIAVLGAKLTATGHVGSDGGPSAPTVTITVV